MPSNQIPEHIRFVPLNLKSGYNRTIVGLGQKDCSNEVLANKTDLLTGDHELWGIPFMLGPDNEGNNIILAKDTDVDLAFQEPIIARQLIFLHAADFKETPVNLDGIASPMMGTPRLGETVCEYLLQYADGTEAIFPMRRRYQISEFQINWGENSFESVKHIKPRTMQTNTELLHRQAPEIPWGQSQLRTTFPGFGHTMHHWLHALENPHPEKPIIGMLIRPSMEQRFFLALRDQTW